MAREALAGALIFSMIGASAAIWWQIARNRFDVLHGRERTPVQRDRFTPLVAIVGWIVIFVIAAQIVGVKREPSLLNVQMSCAAGAMQTLFLMLLLKFPLDPRIPPRPLAAFGITTAGWTSAVSDGIRGFLVSVLPVFAVLLITSPIRHEELEHSFLQLLQREPDGAVIAWVALAAVVIAPLSEELMFRVVLQGWMEPRVSAYVAIPVVATAFSVIHGWPDMLPLLPLALVLGIVYHRRNSYLAVVVVHALLNASMLTIALLTAGAANEDDLPIPAPIPHAVPAPAFLDPPRAWP